jgi:hypothetical protein
MKENLTFPNIFWQGLFAKKVKKFKSGKGKKGKSLIEFVLAL